MSIAQTAFPRAMTAPQRRIPAHVVLLVNFIPPYRLPLYQALAERVDRLTVLLSTEMEGNRSWETDWGGLDVRLQKSWTLKTRWRHPSGFQDRSEVHIPWDTYRQLRSLRPDVVLSCELGGRSLLSVMHKLGSCDTRLVLWAMVSEHTEQGRGLLRRKLRKALLRHADAVVVNGASGSRYIQGYGCDPQRIVEVPYVAGPDTVETLPRARDEAAAHRMLYVGQLIDRKGLMPFMDGLKRFALRHPDRSVEFALAGEGPLAEAIGSYAGPSNLSIELLGACSYSELRTHYADAGIFAFPTLADEWGLVVNEALASGLSVLGSRYSQAVEELVDDGVGWTFRPDTPGEIDSALERALDTPAETLAAMRSAARERVEHLTPAYAADGLASALELALASSADKASRQGGSR